MTYHTQAGKIVDGVTIYPKGSVWEEYTCLECQKMWITNENLPTSLTCPICRGDMDEYYQPTQ